MNREEYEKDLKYRQQAHLDGVQGREQQAWRPCLHDECSECVGTGIKKTGGTCVHAISCPCPKCSAY